jgi:hypothetical protein
VAFIPTAILATFLFLAGIWGYRIYAEQHTFANLPPLVSLLVISLAPPAILLLVVVLVPMLSSPIWPYQVAIFQEPEDQRLRWNLAVVATAHTLYGHIAQAEWLNQLIGLGEDERFQALCYIRRVHFRLQQMPFFTPAELMTSIIAGLAVIGISMGLLGYEVLDALLHSIALMAALQLLLLYLFLLRWLHTRRLSEIEEVFEELLPITRKTKRQAAAEDEVAQWDRERWRHQHPEESAAPPDPAKLLPPAPWEK